MEDESPSLHKPEERTTDIFSPPPPQTAPVTQHSTNNDDDTSEKNPTHLPHDLDAMKKFIQHDKEDV